MRYRLSTLLIFVTISAALLGAAVYRAKRQEQAVAFVHKAGGQVYYDFDGDEEYTSNRFRKLLGDSFCSTVRRVDLADAEFHENELSKLRCFSHLEELWLWYTPTTDRGLALLDLRRFRRLELLNLKGTSVTDEGLAQLRYHAKIRWLDLDNTRITDAGLSEVKTLSNLKMLYLEDTRITDAGLAHLAGMTQLEEINLLNTAVTDRGAWRLQECLPRCNIYWGPFPKSPK
jgi:hypothetical protein